MKKMLVLLLLSTQVFGISHNDVSLLLPLSKNLLSPQIKGRYGEILPRAMVEALPDLTPQGHNEDYYLLRAVSLRIDPCFPSEFDSRCVPQIRLVWQIVIEKDGQLNTKDAAVHVSYDVSETDLDQFLKVTTHPANRGRDLGLHPVFLDEGVEGPFAQKVFLSLLSFIGSARISRITFISVGPTENTWDFGGIDLIQGQIQPVIIPRILSVNQTFLNSAQKTNEFFGGLSPAPKGKDHFNILLGRSQDITHEQAPEILSAVGAAYRVENPRTHSIHSVDCVSCHTAQPAKAWALKHFPELKLENFQDKYVSEFSINNTSKFGDNTQNLRAFGYFQNRPAISQRTINETAEILAHFNKKSQ